MNAQQSNDTIVTTTGVVGTVATWTLSGTLSVIATICTLIVVGPKAWEQVVTWYRQFRNRRNG